MRLTCLAAILIAAFAGPAPAFEVEEHVVYDAPAPATTLRILSTADRNVFEPIIRGFQAQHPGISIDYTIASTTELMRAISEEGAVFDVVVSSAMDLQTKLANDGFARSYRSPATDALPGWARWRDQLFAFTQEPAVLILSDREFGSGPVPRTRNDLIELLRDQPDRFRGKVGTYDVRQSGFGYLMATQDVRVSESVWRLIEVMGRLDTRLYCCSGDMLRDIREGRLSIAYNVLGSYAAADLAHYGGYRIVEMQDFDNVMLRTVMIPRGSTNLKDAGTMVDFLVGLGKRPDLEAASGLPAIDPEALRSDVALRPIRLGPGLLAYLDRLKRENFLRNWTAAITQD